MHLERLFCPANHIKSNHYSLVCLFRQLLSNCVCLLFDAVQECTLPAAARSKVDESRVIRVDDVSAICNTGI